MTEWSASLWLEAESQPLSGLLQILWERREGGKNGVVSRQRCGKVMMLHGGERKMNGICYVTKPVFARFLISVNRELHIKWNFYELLLFTQTL